jgi:ZIP family zinc transporter
MATLFQKIMLFSLVTVFTMIAGYIVAIYRKSNGNIRSLIFHFSAGVVFSVVAVELLPDVVKEHKPIQGFIGFSLGLITKLIIRGFSESKVLSNKNNNNCCTLNFCLNVSVD